MDLWRLVVLSAMVVGCGSTSGSGTKPSTAGQSEDSTTADATSPDVADAPSSETADDRPNPAPQAELITDGVLLRYPKRTQGRAQPMSLSVKYTFKGVTKEAMGVDEGTGFLVRLEGRPGPDERVRLVARYRFETDPAALLAAAREVVLALGETFSRALAVGTARKPAYEAVWVEAWKPGGSLFDLVARLDAHVRPDGQTATAYLIGKLPFVRMADGTWRPKTKADGTLAEEVDKGPFHVISEASGNLQQEEDQGKKATLRTTIDTELQKLVPADTFTEESFERETFGLDILKGDVGTRLYEILTGVVYAPGLGDLAMPILVSICPFNGCRDPKEPMWSSARTVGQSFSFDFGVRASTLDTPSARAGEFGFMFGASVSVFPLVRFSGGVLVFEDPTVKEVRFDGYWGLTLDLVSAVELLGVTGLRIPTAPVVNP